MQTGAAPNPHAVSAGAAPAVSKPAASTLGPVGAAAGPTIPAAFTPVNNESSGSGGAAPGINLPLAHADHVDHLNTLAAEGQAAPATGTLQLPSINPTINPNLNQQQFGGVPANRLRPTGSSSTSEGLLGQAAGVAENAALPGGQLLHQQLSNVGEAALGPITKAFANFDTNPQHSLGGTISQGLGDLGHLFTGNTGGNDTPSNPNTNGDNTTGMD